MLLGLILNVNNFMVLGLKFGKFWLVVGGCGWEILAACGWLWVILGGYGWLWVGLARCGWIWLVPRFSMYACGSALEKQPQVSHHFACIRTG